jgi:predicted YcjX-like family ATPase
MGSRWLLVCPLLKRLFANFSAEAVRMIHKRRREVPGQVPMRSLPSCVYNAEHADPVRATRGMTGSPKNGREGSLPTWWEARFLLRPDQEVGPRTPFVEEAVHVSLREPVALRG